MKITLINGNPDAADTSFDDLVEDISGALEGKGHAVELFSLKELKVIPCTGCWGCWVKTPGECLFDDDTMNIRRSAIHSGLVVFASPMIMGFTSALLKKVQDKLIPLLHPYIELVNNECHHRRRYDKYPRIGLLYKKETDTSDEDLSIMTAIYERFALNFRSGLRFALSIEEPVKNICHEIGPN